METGNVAIDDYLARLEQASQSLPPGQRVELLAEIRAHIDEARRAETVPGEAGVQALLERLGSPEEIVAAATEGAPVGVQTGSFGVQTGSFGGEAGSFGDQAGSFGVQTRSFGSPPAPKESTALEVWAVVMLSLGSIVLPVIGWLIGVALLWSSRRWRIGEKLLGTLVVPGGLGTFLILGVVGIGGGSSEGCAGTAVQAGTGVQTGASVTTDTCTGADGSGLMHLLLPAGFIIAALAALIVPFYLLHAVRARTTTAP